MLYKRTSFPEEGEIVLCTVTKIYHHSVFANLDEYGTSGLLHISEVSPGRIRNIRDYVQEGKKIVCKILRTDKAKGHIDLSLRRVSESQRRAKNDLIKQEQTAEKIVEFTATELKQPVKKLYETITKALFKEYEYLSNAFSDVVDEDLKLESLGVDKKIASALEKIIRERIKSSEVSIGGEFEIISFEPDGIETIKKALSSIESEKTIVQYKGAGKYTFKVTAPDYKEAEATLKESVEKIEKYIKDHNSTAHFTRAEN
ncbi:translation initiation factor IF-2 subunit alpha [Candidatus Woesearchaeota archaeon]|nr:translation initiation factor IF-2 subunit alpha [Candidatus Woesearchaeota archaeon]